MQIAKHIHLNKLYVSVNKHNNQKTFPSPNSDCLYKFYRLRTQCSLPVAPESLFLVHSQIFMTTTFESWIRLGSLGP